jgi:molybdopterin-guanine dinucleotide biosynthesis protein A
MIMRIRPYILAGGKSSRMGTDKAMLELERKTLLARAVEMLRSVPTLGGQQIQVTILGEREALEGADRAIVDRYPSCGPLGGIEAALNDLRQGDKAEWAFFIPVDMPLLASGLIDHLLTEWIAAIESECRPEPPVTTCFTVVEGRPQPLVSLVHRSMHSAMRNALEEGHYKVVPVLQSGRAHCTSLDLDREATFVDSPALEGHHDASREDLYQAARNESLFRAYSDQFINVNTEADLIRVATLLKQRGSNKQP